MELLAQNLLNGLTIGAFYALVALGYTMVYGVLKLINFAHGDLFMWGAYLGCTGFTLLLALGLRGGPWMIVPVIVGVMVVVALVGVLLERMAYRPLRARAACRRSSPPWARPSSWRAWPATSTVPATRPTRKPRADRPASADRRRDRQHHADPRCWSRGGADGACTCS